MKFGGNKFELLRYRKEQEIKSAITNKFYDSNTDGKEQVRDLDITMSNTAATFTLHIRNMV